MLALVALMRPIRRLLGGWLYRASTALAVPHPNLLGRPWTSSEKARMVATGVLWGAAESLAPLWIEERPGPPPNDQPTN